MVFASNIHLFTLISCLLACLCWCVSFCFEKTPWGTSFAFRDLQLCETQKNLASCMGCEICFLLVFNGFLNGTPFCGCFQQLGSCEPAVFVELGESILWCDQKRLGHDQTGKLFALDPRLIETLKKVMALSRRFLRSNSPMFFFSNWSKLMTSFRNRWDFWPKQKLCELPPHSIC